jgi:methylated-DNA-protein-cysteine methyltransferase related protein
MVASFEQAKRKILQVVAAIPKTKVLSYGLVAQYAGLPGRARLVGRALRSIGSDDPKLPWWRVVRADGSVAIADQLQRLRKEGAPVSDLRVQLARALWDASDWLAFAMLD